VTHHLEIGKDCVNTTRESRRENGIKAAIIFFTVRFMHRQNQKYMLVILLENMIFCKNGRIPARAGTKWQHCAVKCHGDPSVTGYGADRARTTP